MTDMDESSGDGKVVFLAFSNPKPAKERIDSIVLTGCAQCKNKTFTLVHDIPDYFPRLRCAACGQNMGRMGYAPEPGE